jgi:hypothetical protein
MGAGAAGRPAGGSNTAKAQSLSVVRSGGTPLQPSDSGTQCREADQEQHHGVEAVPQEMGADR